jgi:peptidoglycan/LPS O-acetylase OafA/YrhL
MKRIPTLDGWRGIAILFVLFDHIQRGIVGHLFGGYAWMDVGQLGVTIFFVLSGYLITRQLLANEISLPQFYLRRFFRIMPCICVYLLFILLLSLAIHKPLIGRDALSSLLFVRNYYPATETGTNTLTGHFWALSVEMQFYLFWPGLLILMRRRWALLVASVAALGIAFFRLFAWADYEIALRSLHTEVRADALLVGCILAILLESQTILSWFSHYGKVLFDLCIPALAWHIYHFQQLIPLSESLLIAGLIGCTSLNPTSPPSRVLKQKNLEFTGKMSYSYYIWQEMFLRSFWGPFSLLLLGSSAIVSWKFLERPCIKIGRHIENRLFQPQPIQPEAPAPDVVGMDVDDASSAIVT